MIALAQQFVGVGLILAGLAFMFFGSLGIITLPDFFSRTHAASKVDTVGIVVLLLGIGVLEGWSANTVKILVAAVFLMFTNPVAAHALARAARWTGLRPWQRGEPVPADAPERGKEG
jgi:multicomponent Na+:H+ antiporter subunit G